MRSSAWGSSRTYPFLFCARDDRVQREPAVPSVRVPGGTPSLSRWRQPIRLTRYRRLSFFPHDEPDNRSS